MDTIYIHGGITLQGQVRIQGSKNAVLPIMAASLLTNGVCSMENCPRLRDVYLMQILLKSLGCKVVWEKDRLKIDASKVDMLHALCGMPGEAVTGMRSSVILLGALLGRVGEVFLEYPGGCVIGKRPIDIHMDALRQMNVSFEETAQGIHAFTRKLKGADITLRMPSVGATENVILAAVCAEGVTMLHGAAREPEVACLCEFLNKCGAGIEGAGSDTLKITGQRSLTGCDFRIPGDRIVAGTYLCACMAAGGEVLLRDAPVVHMRSVLLAAEKMGAGIQETKEGIYVQMHERPKALSQLVTQPYPGFPTDMQSLFLTVCTLAEGETLIRETIFENRFHTVDALNAMGADITKLDAESVRIKGVEKLHGTTMEAAELRGGAALIVAGAAAEGATVVDGGRYIERGYENICRDLRELGVRIYGV